MTDTDRQTDRARQSQARPGRREGGRPLLKAKALASPCAALRAVLCCVVLCCAVLRALLSATGGLQDGATRSLS